MAANISLKRVQINKANTTMVAAIALAAFALTFTLVAGRALLSKRAYQSRVIAGKELAVKQLQANIKASNSLADSYKVFVGSSENVLGGNPKGTGDKDGDNAKVTLDALPSQYDFPALTSSLEKIMTGNGFKVKSITGSDDEIAQQKAPESSKPQVVPIPFQVSLDTDATGAKNILTILERSIRPINVQQVTLTGSNSSLQMTIDGQTYYQPAKSLTIETKDVK
jgi:hypothetical protein